MTSIRHEREIEGRDSVGLYLDEIARTPLLDAATEVELSKTIEAGLFAQSLLDEGRVGRRKGGAPKYATEEELQWLVEEGERAMPGEMLDQLREAENAMQEAQRELSKGQGEEGLELQKKAHRLLEMARAVVWMVLEPFQGVDEGDVPSGHERDDAVGGAVPPPPEVLQAQRETARRPASAEEDPPAFRESSLDALGEPLDPPGVGR